MNHKKLLLTLTLCLCALLCMVVTASASEVQVHSHPVCGATHTNIGDHTGTCGDVTWTAWNGPAANGDTNITYDSNNTAYIYLADNVTTEYSIEVREGKTLYLCLNGKSITKSSEDTNLTGNRSVIDFTEGGSLILCDCQDTGSITHTEGVTGRGVNVGGRNEGNGTFIMYGGAISGNNCVYGDGGGVYVYGTFTMYGGTIKENKSTSANGSGGVDANCRTFAMYGGTITGNEAVNGWGGGISLNMGYSPSGVKAIISGGAITNNKAADMGGGVHIANGTLTLSGNTTITGNTCGADSHGGGVSTYEATIELASSNVTIADNKDSNGRSANLYLNADDQRYNDGSYIEVTGDLGSKVFTLTTENAPVVGTPITISQYCNADVLNAQNFKYENNDQVSIAVIPTGGQALLKACIHSFTRTSTASKYLKSSATCTSEAVYYKSCACGLASSTETFTSGAIDPNNHALVHHEAKAPTCTAVGWEAYDTCSHCDYTTKVEIQMAPHSYGTPTYVWADDNASCTAKRTCTACQHVEDETVNTQKQVTQNRSCTLNELSTFTATFTNTAFAQQTKENVKTADMTGHSYGTPTYVWAIDNTTCKAEHKCTACQHVEDETVNTQQTVTQNHSCTLNELSTFTATFTNTAFARQTKENVKTADMTGHSYSATEWESDVDNHWHKCAVCHTQIDKAAHEWQPATYTAPKTCTVCGATQGEPLTRSYYYYAPSVAEGKKDSPKTADPGVLLYAGLALASLTGLACTAKKRH